MGDKSASVRKAAFECVFGVISYEDYDTTKFLIEAGVFEAAVNELRNGDALVLEAAWEAANLIFWMLMNGKSRKLNRDQNHLDQLNDQDQENKFLTEFEVLGGREVIEELTMHPNRKIKDIWNEIISTFYRFDQNDDYENFNEENELIYNNKYGFAEYSIPDAIIDTNNLLRF